MRYWMTDVTGHGGCAVCEGHAGCPICGPQPEKEVECSYCEGTGHNVWVDGKVKFTDYNDVSECPTLYTKEEFMSLPEDSRGDWCDYCGGNGVV